MAPPKRKSVNLSIIFFLIAFTIFNIYYQIRLHDEVQGTLTYRKDSDWFDVIAREFGDEMINIGLVNMNETMTLGTKGKIVKVDFHRVDSTTQWSDLYPGWISEEHDRCPELPMPVFAKYEKLDVVVARVPYNECVGNGVRDVSRLQVNLVVANLLVRCGRRMISGVNRPSFAVFIGPCGAMWDVFRCDDLVFHGGDYWIYKPQLWRIKQKVFMPVGGCQLSPPFSHHGEGFRKQQPRQAYATVLHSSDKYVCGAIALAQSIIQSNSTKDLILLADEHISPKSIDGLRLAGWKIKRIQRIRDPHSDNSSYSLWNFSKFRLWQLQDYDKVMFVDADLVVTRNIDHLFLYPQMSAAWNNIHIFNSGLMILEPSACTFHTLMATTLPAKSYKDSDQGFLNDMFPWWHRLPRKVNRLKYFGWDPDPEHRVEDDVYVMHYLGLKPWKCYRDYDCNWDHVDYRKFASDFANDKWWRVYDKMPEKLRPFCALDPETESRIQNNRNWAKKTNSTDGHWRIKVRDPRQIQSPRLDYSNYVS